MPLMRIKLKPFINELLIQMVIKINFNIIKTLLGRQKKLVLPDYSEPITLASTFNMYFIDKIANIRSEFPLLESFITAVLIWVDRFYYAYLCKLF